MNGAGEAERRGSEERDAHSGIPGKDDVARRQCEAAEGNLGRENSSARRHLFFFACNQSRGYAPKWLNLSMHRSRDLAWPRRRRSRRSSAGLVCPFGDRQRRGLGDSLTVTTTATHPRRYEIPLPRHNYLKNGAHRLNLCAPCNRGWLTRWVHAQARRKTRRRMMNWLRPHEVAPQRHSAAVMNGRATGGFLAKPSRNWLELCSGLAPEWPRAEQGGTAALTSDGG